MRLFIVTTITILLFLLLSFGNDSSAYYFRGQIIPDPVQVPMWSNTPASPMQQQQPSQSEPTNQFPSYTAPPSTPTIAPTTPTIQSNQLPQSQSQTPTTPSTSQPTTQQPGSLTPP
jgi:hypothetical protein